DRLPHVRAGVPQRGRQREARRRRRGRRDGLPALRFHVAPAQDQQLRAHLGVADAGFILYIPANVLPIMRTASLNDVDDNTIISGVVELWTNGSVDLAIIVFLASIVVPMLKFLSLGMLLVSSQRGSDWARPQRARLYRLVEFIGYWSMLDVFVVALLTALVRFNVLSRVEPLPGVIFFGLTVVLTMLASMSFDPRLIWDGRNTDD